jgi:hypothetical protein
VEFGESLLHKWSLGFCSKALDRWEWVGQYAKYRLDIPTTQIIFHTADVYTRLVWYVNMRLAKFTTSLLAVGPSKPSLNWLMVTESVCSYLLTGAKPISSDEHDGDGDKIAGTTNSPWKKSLSRPPSIESRENTF